MTGEVKLLPCPFCGTQAKPEAWADDDDLIRAVCQHCEAQGPCFKSTDEAIAAWNTRPTLVTGQLQDDGGELKACPLCGSEVFLEPGYGTDPSTSILHKAKDGGHDCPLADGVTDWNCESDLVTLWNTRAASETPTPGLTDDVVKELLDETPTGAFGLPRWKYLLRADAACLSCTDQTLAAEYRKHLAQRLGNLGRIIEALLARTGVTLK